MGQVGTKWTFQRLIDSIFIIPFIKLLFRTFFSSYHCNNIKYQWEVYFPGSAIPLRTSPSRGKEPPSARSHNCRLRFPRFSSSKPSPSMSAITRSRTRLRMGPYKNSNSRLQLQRFTGRNLRARPQLKSRRCKPRKEENWWGRLLRSTVNFMFRSWKYQNQGKKHW